MNIRLTFLPIFRLSLEDLNRDQTGIYSLQQKPFWLKLTDPLDKSLDVVPYIPWFLACNPGRFPYWYGLPDPRNKLILEAMTSQDITDG